MCAITGMAGPYCFHRLWLFASPPARSVPIGIECPAVSGVNVAMGYPLFLAVHRYQRLVYQYNPERKSRVRILITGGDGFIGRYVQSRAKELGIDFDVFDISSDITQDITNYGALSGGHGDYDAIIHLAGMLGTHELWDTAEDAIDVNIKGALNVGRLALEHDAKLVSIEQPHIWYNVYEATKLAARRMLTGLHYDEGLRVDFVTAHNAFGPGQAHGPGHPQKIIPTFATKAWTGELIPIWGDGSQKVNLVYAGDVADMLIRRAIAEEETEPLRQYNAGTDRLLTVNDVAANVWIRTGGDVANLNLDMRRGEQDCDYPEPDESYEYRLNWETLDATIDSYKP